VNWVSSGRAPIVGECNTHLYRPIVAGTSVDESQPLGKQTLAQCSERFQYNCVRQLTLFAAELEGSGAAVQFAGGVDDLALWARAVDAQDVAFMHATGLDGVPLIDMLGDSLPSYVYREKPTLDIRKDDIRYLPPPGAEATTTATIAETLAGKVIEPTVCETRELEAGGNRKPQDLDVYAVQQDGAVNIVTDVFEVTCRVGCLHSTLACLTSCGM
jgi:hypothetical protein